MVGIYFPDDDKIVFSGAKVLWKGEQWPALAMKSKVSALRSNFILLEVWKYGIL